MRYEFNALQSGFVPLLEKVDFAPLFLKVDW